jgi:hypothetical protein
LAAFTARFGREPRRMFIDRKMQQRAFKRKRQSIKITPRRGSGIKLFAPTIWQSGRAECAKVRRIVIARRASDRPLLSALPPNLRFWRVGPCYDFEARRFRAAAFAAGDAIHPSHV